MRNSNLELLRIISMLLIVCHHYIVHGYDFRQLAYGPNLYLLGPTSFIGGIGVVCFVLISGYFMVYSRITLTKIVKILAETFFYSVIIASVFYFYFRSYLIGQVDFLSEFFSVGYSRYWFITNYVFLMCLSPGLNLVISSISRETHLWINFTGIFFLSVLPTFLSGTYAYNLLLFFVLLYMIAAYIRKYIDIDSHNGVRHLMIFLLLGSIIFLTGSVLIYFSQLSGENIFRFYCRKFCYHNSVFVILAAVELFIFFLKLRPFYSPWINKIASATLGVYLIHDNEFIRNILWHRILRTDLFEESPYLLIHGFVSVTAVYFVCTLIDWLRAATVGKLLNDFFFRYLSPHKEAMEARGKKLFDRGEKLLNRYYSSK